MNPPPLDNPAPEPSRLAIPDGFEGLVDAGESVLEQFQSLGLSTHAVMGLVFLGGLLLWLFGGKSLRIGFGLLGMLVGAQAGMLVPAMLGYDTPDVIAAVTGGALGLLVGLVAFKFTVAWTMAVLLGSLGLVGTAVYFDVKPDFSPPAETEVQADEPAEDEERSVWDEIYEEYERLREQATGSLPGEDSLVPEIPESAFPDDPEARERYQRRLDAAEEGARQLSEVFRSVRERLRPTWEQLPTGEKGMIVVIGLAGNIVGFALGTIATKKSAVLITAFAGPLIWVPALIWLGAAFGAPGLDRLPSDPIVWALVWFVLSALGLFVQWRRPRETTDKSA